MNYYSIKDLEYYSGIKAHTIRIWEKRYNLLDPARTKSNIRLYDDDQLIKLLNTVTLLNQGWKISKVSQLSKQELLDNTQKCLKEIHDHNYEGPVNALVATMFSFDEAGFIEILDRCIDKLGFENTFFHVIYPFLTRVGLMWRLKEICPGQEHFVSNMIRQKLIVTLDLLPRKGSKNTSFVLFLPQDELHELGLLMTHYILRQRHYRSIYLGQTTPIASLIPVVENVNPDVLVTFMVSRRPVGELNNYIRELGTTFSSQKIWIIMNKECLAQMDKIPENIHLINTIEVFEDLLLDLS